MLRIKVVGIDEAPEDFESFAPVRVVSLLDPDIKERYWKKFIRLQSISNKIGQNHRTWFFDDYDSDKLVTGPKLHITREAIEFVGSSDERVLVHCHAGISRSSAIAFGVLLLDGWDPESAFRVLFSSRVDQLTGLTMMWPNAAIMRHLEFLFSIGSLFELSRDLIYEPLLSHEELVKLHKKPRTPRKMIELSEPAPPSVTDEMWDLANLRTK